MTRQRTNPFTSGTVEHLLFARYRRTISELSKIDEQLAHWNGQRIIEQAKAQGYADALRALGHGDKVPGQMALPDLSSRSNGGGAA